MEELSLLICKTAFDRRAEMKSWLCIAFAAMALILVGAEAGLVSLWFGFVIALCLRGRAQAAAKQMRDAWRRACQWVERGFIRFWKLLKSIHAAEYQEMLTAWSRTFTALKAFNFHQPNFGLPLVGSPPGF